jgi:hypothetical protein
VTRFLSLLCGLLVLGVGCGGPEPVPEETGPPRLLFLGDPESPRTPDFETFLTDRFGAVLTADRWDWDRSLLEEVDVVVLDWPQDDGVSKWMLAGDRTVPPRSPLGTRNAWTIPTLLLGSAGLNTAWAWDVKGGFG